MKRYTSVCYLFSLISCLTVFPFTASAADKKNFLINRVLTTNGDMKTVALWRWLNDLTGNRAAVVLSEPNDLADIRVPRAWKKGQTIGEVVRAAEVFLGRFRVVFQENAVTLRSLTADELLRRKDYKKAVNYDRWEADYEVMRTGFWIHGYAPALVSDVSTVNTMFGGGLGVVFRLYRNSLSGIARLEYSFADQPDYSSESTMRTLFAGLRWNAAYFGSFGLYLQGGLSGSWFSGPGEDLSGTVYDWSGLGLRAGGGINWWFTEHLRAFAEVSYSATWLRHTSDAMRHTVFRLGFGYGL